MQRRRWIKTVIRYIVGTRKVETTTDASTTVGSMLLGDMSIATLYPLVGPKHYWGRFIL